jgi:hypothetical protein
MTCRKIRDPDYRATSIAPSKAEEDTAEALLRTSKRLKNLASAERRWVGITVLCGAVHTMSLSSFDLGVKYTLMYSFVLSTASMAVLRLVGLEGLAALSPKLAVKSMFVKSSQSRTSTATADVQESSVGTLGS